MKDQICISLCGIKHAGKSSVGTALAELLSAEFIDTDDFICEYSGGAPSIRQVYQELGEQGFRMREAEAVGILCAQKKFRVYALGGGTLSNPYLAESDRESLGFLCWLDTSDRIAYNRILKHGLPPFLADKEDPFAAFCEMNQTRRKIFREYADFRILADSVRTKPRDTAGKILDFYGAYIYE